MHTICLTKAFEAAAKAPRMADGRDRRCRLVPGRDPKAGDEIQGSGGCRSSYRRTRQRQARRLTARSPSIERRCRSTSSPSGLEGREVDIDRKGSVSTENNNKSRSSLNTRLGRQQKEEQRRAKAFDRIRSRRWRSSDCARPGEAASFMLRRSASSIGLSQELAALISDQPDQGLGAAPPPRRPGIP